MAIKRNVTQVILEGRDDDLELIFSCHPHIQEAFTMMELAEPDADLLRLMARASLLVATGANLLTLWLALIAPDARPDPTAVIVSPSGLADV